ncbi:hypothetical protein [Acidihalobacter prosperus]|nr:hypothetical protein [Acidihalobacter prosperus]
MKPILSGTAAAMGLTLVLSGCGPLRPAHIDNMPGSDRMAPGPGVMDRHSPYATSDGLMLYSDNPRQPSVFGSKRAPTTSEAPNTPESSQPNGAARAKTPDTGLPASDHNEQETFKAFEAYQRFMRLPKDSKAYRDFKAWLQWRRYEAWKNAHDASPKQP